MISQINKVKSHTDKKSVNSMDFEWSKPWHLGTKEIIGTPRYLILLYIMLEYYP